MKRIEYPALLRGIYKKNIKKLDYIKYPYWKFKLKLENPQLKKPIFMIGSPRSGTTIGVKLFATHEWVANWSEAGHIWDKDYYNHEKDHYWPKSKVTDKDRERLHSIFEHYRCISNKQRFLNKHPRNSMRLEYINDIFPDAYIVHIVRDGRAVANSVKNAIMKSKFRQRYPFGLFCKPKNWKEYGSKDIIDQSAYLWRDIVEYISETKSIFGRRFVEVKYEDLVINPRKTLSYLYNSVELPSSEEFLTDIPIQLNNMNFKYKQDIQENDLERIEMIQLDILKQYGYLS